MIFLRATLTSLAILLIGSILLAWHLGIISEKDLQAYRELSSLSNLKSTDPKVEPYSAKQERYKIIKEFYLEGDKKFVRLKSRTSSLVYEQKDGAKEVVEKMSGVVCMMQEEVYALLPDGTKACKQPNGKFLVSNANPEDAASWPDDFAIMQDILCVHCNQAYYHYQTQNLDAENVLAERFTIPGDSLPDDFEEFEAAFRCTAASAKIALNKTISFHASLVEANYKPLDAEPLRLCSNEAVYSSKQLSLNGNVQFQHSLGIAQAQKADIHADEQSQITAIQLHNSIVFNLKDGSKLMAESADIDCLTRKAWFYGNSDAKVQYFGVDELFLESASMNIAWDKGISARKMVKTLNAEEEVVIYYRGNIEAFGDFACYSANEIVLKSHKEENPCKVIMDKQNHVLAKHIILNTCEKKALFHHPYGFLNREKEKVLFSAKIMEWDEKEMQLILKESVEIEEPAIGVLKTNGPVSLIFKDDAGRKRVARIECEGESLFVHTDAKEEEHELATAGKLIIDHENSLVTIASKEGEKITYKDHHGHIMANNASLRYSQDKKIILEKMFLDGDICIVNQVADMRDSLTQYILADLGEYTFADKELTLSEKESRVLFYDKINQIELSAPVLKIKRDAITEKDSIKGVGDVRFVFAAQELEKIKHRFKFSEANHS